MVLPRHFTLLLPLLSKILQHVLLVDDVFFPVLEINYVYVLGVRNKKMVQYIKNWLHTYTPPIVAVHLHELLPSIHLVLQ